VADDYKYHIDHHGSLVRPAALQVARASGDAAVLAATEQEAVVAAAHVLRRLALSAVSDGQFRRDYFEAVVHEHVDGFGPASGPAPLGDAAGIPEARRRATSDSLHAIGRLAADEPPTLLATVDRPVFVQLPSPGYLAAVSSALASSADIDSVRARGAALAEIIRAEIEALSADGVSYVALENPLYPPLLTVAGRAQLAAAGVDVDAVLAALLEADRAAVSGLTDHETFRVGLDLTDSGPLPTTSQGYDGSAVDVLLDANPFHRLGIDFPAAPAARFPLERIKPGLVISLGVVDVSQTSLEPVDDILDRIDPVYEKRTEDDIAVATNGGFAQSADTPLMTEEEQTAKLRLVETVARYYWGNEL
jgi:5-methyltetrahydropteroyltriglutamate--homocysteine methyltransferase